MPQSLPISRLIKVAVSLTPTAAQAQNLSTLLILGSSTVIDTVERFRNYESIDAVAADFGTTAAEYLAAVLWFQQAPQPTKLKIGRWVSAAASGVLRGAPLSAAQQQLSNFVPITGGSFSYSKNGAQSINVANINLSGATNLNGVAATITASLTGAVVTWNSTFSRFEVVSTTTGDTSSISFFSAASVGTDLSALLGLRSTSSGAYVAPGKLAETALDVVTLFDQNFGQSWYAVVVVGATNSDHLAISGYVEASNTKHVYGITTQEGASLVASATADIGYQLKQLKYNKTFTQYSSFSPYAVVSLLGRILTVDYTGNNTVITLAYKQEPGIVAEALNSSQADALKDKNVNAFLAFNNDTAIIMPGVAASGNFIDTVTGTDWLAVTIQNSLYNVLYTATTKVPQTDAGMQLLSNTAEAVCAQAVSNGLLAPGVWNSSGFGLLKQGDFIPKGYYIYTHRMDAQNPADRAARKSAPVQIAAKLAGAIHEINMSVTVNQ